MLIGKRSSHSNRFQQLRWRLTLTYAGVTVGALLTVELVLLVVFGIGLVVVLNSGFLQAQLIEAASLSYTPILRPYLKQKPPDMKGIAEWLENVGAASSVTVQLDFDASDEMFVVGSDGKLLGVRPAGLLGSEQIGLPLDFQTVPGLADPLQAALAGAEDVDQLYSLSRPDEKVIITVPIWDADHEQVLGVLVGMGEFPTIMNFLGDALPILGFSLLCFTLFAGLIGSVYGFLAARQPVQRLNHLGEATLAWSQGDFSVHVDDSTGDELGQLAQRLNHMAQQLQTLLDTRHELAVVEERNRLARDLHDSAKQLAFAAAAQMNAARTSLKQNPQAAENHIDEAERLTKDLRRELANLIQQLRPAVLESKGLSPGVREYADDWSRQNGISVDVRVQHERSLPLEIEQTIFRIIQEALANIARHSEACRVEIRLVYAKGDITCTISDDGIGFDPHLSHTGFGLHSMEERAEAMGGDFILESALGKGTTISFTAPFSGTAGYNQEEP